MELLLIEDDPGTAEEILHTFANAGWRSDHAATAESGLRLAAAKAYAVIVLDRMLPDGDGLAVLRALRQRQILTPVLVLSALADVDHKVAGLGDGADDYLAKPYWADELCARVRVLSRRALPHPEVLLVADLEIWTKAGTAFRGGRRLDLSPKEFELLRYLAVNAGIPVTRRMILEQVFHWKAESDPGTNVVDVHVSRLRGKLDKGFDRPLLATVRGEGYLLDAGS
jgi:two-component system OmpR family response regulator